MDFKEAYLKICPEGFYANFNDLQGYYECLACNMSCKNCLGPGSNNCTECY